MNLKLFRRPELHMVKGVQLHKESCTHPLGTVDTTISVATVATGTSSFSSAEEPMVYGFGNMELIADGFPY